MRFSGRVRSERLKSEPGQAAGAVTALPAGRPSSIDDRGRVRIAGKFLQAGRQKLWIRGVTYGAFQPDIQGREYQDLATVDRDFAAMAASGINAVRIPHTTPPRALLDAAQRHGLRVMVGLSAEQYVGYLIDRHRSLDISAHVRERVRSCAGHPAVLCYALGNEIPSGIARWLGARRVERYLERMCTAVKRADPGALVTYANYPSTEYLRLPFLDFLCFNVYLESQTHLAAYLARLQNLAGDRPLVLGELGLDSLRNGEVRQAETLDWQIRTAFTGACAGVFVFSWTDEWYRHGAVDNWQFGLTRADRTPKPALAAVRSAFERVPFPKEARDWPRISVIVCSHNGAPTLRECLGTIQALEYPDFEVIVVDDGSTDGTAAIATEHGCRVVTLRHEGLSRARNAGLAAATGDLVAYIDDDAYPDSHWLFYLTDAFGRTTHAAIGGPNVPPAGDGVVADCVGHAPGGPIHVLVSDEEAEHIAGCNMAFRRSALLAVGGFDPQFSVAGDDVDLCWRVRQRGWTIGFSPGAMVWHHRRRSVSRYWKQQYGYGKAEALLERKWPDKYNSLGHIAWAGRIYVDGILPVGRRAQRIYHGLHGSAPFQSLYAPAPGLVASLPLMPEWYLLVALLAGLSALGVHWSPLLSAVPLLLLAVGTSVVRATIAARRAALVSSDRRLTRGALIAWLHLLQPLARLAGRLRDGLTLWRRPRARGAGPIWPRQRRYLLDCGRPVSEWLGDLIAELKRQGPRTVPGGPFNRWDVEVRNGMFGGARLLMAAEDLAGCRQLLRVRFWPSRCGRGVGMTLVFGALAAATALDDSWAAAAMLAAPAVLIAGRALQETAGAMAALDVALGALGLAPEPSGSPQRSRRPDSRGALFAPRELRTADVPDGGGFRDRQGTQVRR